MAGTSWPNLVAGTPARASDVEAKFDWLEGNIDPMLAGTKADATYDLGTATFRWRDIRISRDIYMGATGKLYLDNGGDTYIIEGAANIITWTIGGNDVFTGITTGCGVYATKRLFLDGGGDTYWVEGSANNTTFTVGGNDVFTGITTGAGVFSNKRLFLDGGGDTYWVESSANNVTLTVGGNDVFTNGSGVHIWLTGGGTARLTIDNSGNIYPGTAALATSATDGFIYIQSCAGKPSGTPTTVTGRIPTIVDTSNNIPYFYANGAWRPMGGIFGIKQKSIQTTTAAATTTMLNVAGQGRLKSVYISSNAAGATSTVQIVLDGITLFSGNFTIGSTVFYRNFTTTTNRFLSSTFTTTQNAPFYTSSAELDFHFLSSMSVFAVSADGGTATTFVEYESS